MRILLAVVAVTLSLTLSGCCLLGTVLPLHNYGVIAGAEAPAVAAKPAKKEVKAASAADTKKALAGIAETTSSGDTVKVNLSGDFTFKKGSAELSPAAAQKIKSIADVLKKSPNDKVTVVGYTDNSGEPGRNQKLSERRAKAVANELVKDGVAKANVLSEGRGQKEPVASNDTEEGRAKNRRTELRISTK